MNTLKDIIIATLKEEAVQDEHQYPSWLTTFVVPRSRFVEAARAMKKADARLVAEWATDETHLLIPSPPIVKTGEGQGGGELRGFGIFACFAKASEYLIIKTNAPVDDPTFPTLTKKYPASFRFERQIQSLMGVNPTGHPDNRPWIKHEDWPADAWPLRKTFDPAMYMERVAGEYKFIKAEGIGVFEIPVGPVHAGVIEPGHFRFQAVGEDILNLEKKLGYVHKGIEKRFESMSWEEGVRLAGRVSGDTTVAHSLAYCMAVEAITGCKLPERGLWLRALMLERERIANHIGDIGGICNDAAFPFLLYQLSRLREIVLRTNYKLFGHRLLMDKVVLGGVSVDITTGCIDEILSELNLISDEFERLASIYDENPSLEDRVRDAGVLTPDTAKELGVVGITAKASGQPLDCRIQNPFPPYDRIAPRMTVLHAGDVHSRTWVRVEEVRESIIVIRNILTSLPSGEIKTAIKYPAPDTRGFAVVEGWRGEIVYWIQAGSKGEINRCMVRDPSSVNWLAVEQAIHGNIVPDFPLCNKSFNQSYSGNDL